MPKFSVEVVRVGFGFRTFEVEADSAFKAKCAALEHAGDFEYSEKNVEYEVNSVEPVA